MNRVDNNNSTVSKVLNEPYQFAYSSNTSVTEELLTLAYDVLGRWERSGAVKQRLVEFFRKTTFGSVVMESITTSEIHINLEIDGNIH